MTVAKNHKQLNRWEHFQHESDIGIRATATTCEHAFEQAALALTAVATELQDISCERKKVLTCNAENYELLLVEWLNAIVDEMTISRLLFSSCRVTCRNYRLKAICYGEHLKINKHKPAVEIKGITYHQLLVSEYKPGKWIAQCVVDV